MAKKSFVLKEFSGGINNVGSGRDIEDNQLVECINFNPNSETGALAMSGNGTGDFTIVGAGGAAATALAWQAAHTNGVIRSGTSLFKFDSDYMDLLAIGDVPFDGGAEVSSSAAEHPTEYFLIGSQTNPDDGTTGAHVHILQNKLDTFNSSSGANTNANFLQVSDTGSAHPVFFYANGGVRVVDGESTTSKYWIIRRVSTDFGLHKERTENLSSDPWTSGDSPLVNSWVVNDLRSSIEDAWDWTDTSEITDTARLAQPKESFAHCVESLSGSSGGSPSGESDDGSVMFMVNNHIDNNLSDGPAKSIPHQYQLRSCYGDDIIKLQMVMTANPEGADAGAWSFNFIEDEFYITYYHDNGFETKLTRVRPWYAGWAVNELLADGSNDITQAGFNNVDNIRWFPQTFNNGVLEQDPGSFDAYDFKWLGGSIGANSGIIDGMGIRLQAMIGNQTLVNEAGSVDNYGDTTSGGSMTYDGLQQGKSIKGCRLYLKSSRAYNSDNVYLMCEVDFEKGMRLNGSPKHSSWNFKQAWKEHDTGVNNDMHTKFRPDTENYGRSFYMYCESDISVLPVPVETYKTLNQINYDDLVVPSFKTAVVLNNRTYIGNVRIRAATYPDRMMKSSINKYDTFSDKSFIDVVVQDADEIIHLASIGDKLLQFKKNVLHIINCQADFEVLESTYKYAGVTSPGQVCSTDFGVIWANENGLFFYNGAKIQNLLDFEGSMVLTQEAWSDVVEDYYDATNGEYSSNVTVGYHPKTKDIIIMIQTEDDESNNPATSKGFVFNLYKRNIVRLEERFPGGSKTNFVNTIKGELVYVNEDDGEFKKWSTTPTLSKFASNNVLLTKDITFGNPSTRKTIHSIYVTYKSDGGTNLEVRAQVKYEDFTAEELVSNIGGSTFDLADTSGGWVTKRLTTWYNGTSTVSLRTKLKDITSLQLILYQDSTAAGIPADFELDDISITYREKTLR